MAADLLLCVFNAATSKASGVSGRGARDHRGHVCLVALPDPGVSTGKEKAEHREDRRTLSYIPLQTCRVRCFYFSPK